MACPKNGPCLWVDNLDLCCLGPSGNLPDPCLTDGSPVDQAIIDSAILAASELLWAATGRQFGLCSAVIRPCTGKNFCEDACPDFGFYGFNYSYPWIPARTVDGGWTNINCIGNCCDVCSIELPYPVCEVTEVKVDGEVLLETQYRVDDFRDLVYLWTYGPEVLETVQMFTSVPGEYCTTPIPTSYQFGVENSPGCANAGVYRTFGEGDAPGVSAITITYESPASPLNGGFGFQHPTLGLYTWPELPYLNVGETLKSDVMIDGDGRGHYATVTYVSGPAGGGPSAINDNFNPQSLFWPVNDGVDELRTVQVEFFGPVQAGCWPSCQNLLLDSDQVDTFEVTLTYGRPVPELVKLATAKLACEIILDCVGKPCELPKRVTSISRQGVTMALLDPQDFLEDGRTGIYIVDQAIKTFNPRKLQRRAAVYSIDAQPKWRRAGT